MSFHGLRFLGVVMVVHVILSFCQLPSFLCKFGWPNSRWIDIRRFIHVSEFFGSFYLPFSLSTFFPPFASSFTVCQSHSNYLVCLFVRAHSSDLVILFYRVHVSALVPTNSIYSINVLAFFLLSSNSYGHNRDCEQQQQQQKRIRKKQYN